MSAPLIIAVPSKGRLQENTEAFFGRAGLQLVRVQAPREQAGLYASARRGIAAGCGLRVEPQVPAAPRIDPLLEGGFRRRRERLRHRGHGERGLRMRRRARGHEQRGNDTAHGALRGTDVDHVGELSGRGAPGAYAQRE